MTYYYCTCTASKDDDSLFRTSRGRTPYRKVKADREGICLDCGHYAIAANKEMKLGTNKLYNYITGYKDGITNKRKHRNQQKRKWYDKKRANNDGDLDAQ